MSFLRYYFVSATKRADGKLVQAISIAMLQ